MSDKILRSNWFLCVLLASGIGLVLAQAHLAAGGDIAVMAALLGAISAAFVVLVALLQGITWIAQRLSERKAR